MSSTPRLICLNCRRKRILATPGEAKVRKFCSRGCAASYNNKKTPKRKPTGSCHYCSCPLRIGLWYCSPKCKQNSKRARKQGVKSAEYKKQMSVKGVVAWRKRAKIKAVEYKGGRCEFCGYSRCTRALDFHHRNPEEKDFTISHVTASWDKIKKELDKCVLVCANCHREIHDGLVSLDGSHLWNMKCGGPGAIRLGSGNVANG